jgi:aminoglycoside phosphotransferase family enzyme/predicted kinase
MSGAPAAQRAAEPDWQALARPAAYPHDPTAVRGVSWVQTHLSHVFLTAERVYKFRKAVDLGFVCFLERAERNADCLREVSLNRRLAPDVYLGVAPLCEGGDGGAQVGPTQEELASAGGEEPEHCVVMRRLAEGRDALSLLEAGRLGAAELDRLARLIAQFHDQHGLGVPAPFTPREWLDRCTAPALDNFRLLAEAPPDEGRVAQIEALRARAIRFAEQHADRFEARRRAGRAVDGHGDLHLQHVWYEHDGADPIAVDCLEFSERLRRIDAAADVAFTAMDLMYRERAGLAERFLRVYARERDDFDLYGVVDYFASYRAAVRAKVAALAACDAAIPAAQRARAAESARRHLDLAERLLAPPAPGPLLLVGGVVGTGKTTAAEALADALGGATVSSDRVRKHLAGLAPGERGGAALYTSEARQRVYAELLGRARPVLASGRPAILDATWSQRAGRRRAYDLARALGSRTLFVETRCAPEVALARLARRERSGADASDAGPALYPHSRAGFESYDAETEGPQLVVETDRPSWREELERAAARLAR